MKSKADRSPKAQRRATHKRKSRPLLGMALLLFLYLSTLAGCAVKPYIPEGELFYAGVGGIVYEEKDQSANGQLAQKDMESVLNYTPNNAFLQSAKLRLPVTYPFWINQHYAEAKTFIGRWLYKTFGEDPILLSTVHPTLRATVAEQVLSEYGYFHASVRSEVQVSAKDSVSARPYYHVLMGEPHLLDSIEYQLSIIPPSLPNIYEPSHRLIQKGDPFGVLALEKERQRIAELLRQEGYYFFKPEHIIYEADTLEVPNKVQLRLKLSDKMLPEAYEPWYIGNISYQIFDGERRALTDSTTYNGVLFKYHHRSPVRLATLRSRIRILQDSLYNQEFQSHTLRSMAQLNTFAFTDVTFTPRERKLGEKNYLDVLITSQLDRPYFTELEALFRFKSNNQVGPGVNWSVNKKNLFGRGELLTVEANGSYEWETTRTRHYQTWNINSYALGLTASLTFPRILLPYLATRPAPWPATSKISLYGTMLNRAKFYQQAQFGADLTYRFEPNDYVRHIITPISLNYNHLLETTNRFRKAIEENPILGLSFRNQYIMQLSYLYRYEQQNILSRHGFSIETYFSEAGNMLSLFYKGKRQPNGMPHEILGAPYAQFLKGTIETRYNYKLNSAMQIATRLYAGAIWSYGNMDVPPYTEQFYSGGANSIRGYNVRSIGPGSYQPIEEDPLSFMDRTGDLRFEANLELRYRLLGALELASFLDLGNIWLLRADEHRPDSELKAQYFFRDLALGTGLGLRYNLMDYLVIRFDIGLALHRPDRYDSSYFNTFGARWPLAFHFAIGYPF